MPARAGVDQPTHPATANPVRSTVSFDLTATDEPFGDGAVEDILSPPSNKLPYVLPSVLHRPIAALLALLAITLGGATACGREGSQTNCSLGGCTVTFHRTGTAEISVLGVKAKLVGVEGNSARLEVAGQTVTVPVGGEAAAGSFTVRVEQVTDTAVVVRITP
jgi:hypothetical protein